MLEFSGDAIHSFIINARSHINPPNVNIRTRNVIIEIFIPNDVLIILITTLTSYLTLVLRC